VLVMALNVLVEWAERRALAWRAVDRTLAD
jgi:hypothetical protein